MNALNWVIQTWSHYWQFPLFQMGLGVLVMGIGVVLTQVYDERVAIGLVLVVLGLGSLLYGASHYSEDVKPGKSKRQAQVPTAPAKPKSFGKIELAPTPAKPN